MKSALKGVLVAAVILAVIGGVYFFTIARNQDFVINDVSNEPDDEAVTPRPVLQPLIKVSTPKTDEIVSSPFTILGEAPGTWFFEASFPIQILDANDQVLGTVVAQAQADWMTTAWVPFEATITFETPTTSTGTLVFRKDNPSGLPEHEAEYRLPVRFNLPEQTVKLFYYNEALDKDGNGNILCSKQGLVAVERQIPLTQTPIRDTIELLLKGELTPAERDQGLTTEYPLSHLQLNGVNLSEGQLTLGFLDPDHATTGGSCRVQVLWQQIEATALQFATVQSVEFIPGDLFQP
jgi:hypothetical protein